MINFAILGFGVVGSGVYELSLNNKETVTKKVGKDVNVSRILVRSDKEHDAKHLFTKDFTDILNDGNIQVAVETMGGLEPAFTYTKSLLEAGIHVVTSNKELVATHGKELQEAATLAGVSYLYEGSVGGGIPIIRPLQNCLAANEITEVFGILNGTTNYILTQMKEHGLSFEKALKSAQELGYAESDPTADIEGFDTQRKISILASLAFGEDIGLENIPTTGISALTLKDLESAEAEGSSIKLVGRAWIENGQPKASVEPVKVPKSSPLSTVSSVNNAIVVRANPLGEVMFYGQGAGKEPTASAVMADVISVAASFT
ncbi:MAG: homoserine dehydrogenase [Turicibacter sp.]|nr:homoserine dehydrogenase [Turicibacter sp.]